MADEEAFKRQMLFGCSNHIEKYECEKCCDFQTNFLSSLKDHFGDGHSNKSPQEHFHKCLKCSFQTYSIYLMSRHSLFSKCANEDEKNYKNDKHEFSFELKDEPNECKELVKSNQKSCQSPSAHLDWFHCQQCPHKCKRKSNLKRHISICHINPENIKWFGCKLCPSKFKLKSVLTRHTKLCHSKPEDIQWFQCEQCPLKFKLKSNLTQHIKVSHSKPEDIKWFQCPHCPSKYKLKSPLTQHIKFSHSKPGDLQWFKCVQCASKYKRKMHLTRHVKKCHST